MCNIKPSVLLSTFPLGSKTRDWKAEKAALRLVHHIVYGHNDRWLYAMKEEERQEIHAWVQRQEGVPEFYKPTICYALFSPVSAAAFSPKWREALEQAYSSNMEVNHA